MNQPTKEREVITVLGTIEPSAMGVTYTHEHLILDAMDHYGGYNFVIDDEELVIDELKEFTRRGGQTICDVTLEEIGRNPQALTHISQASGINVVMGAGWYREFGYPRYVAEMTSRELAEVLVKEIEVGVGETGIRAGFIGEIGTGRHFIKPAEERVFRAAALAQQRTGVAVSTHTTRWGTLALEQIAMLREFGTDLSKVIIGHLGDRRGVQHLLPIAEHGVYLEVDNIGYLDYQPESIRADNVAALVKEGFVDRVLSEDICMLDHLKFHGGKGYGYLLEVFIPMLRDRGVDDEDIHKLLVENPARAFAREVRAMPENIYQHYEVPEVINCVGYATRVGGSCPSPEVLLAMEEANQSFVEIDDLQAAASKLIADYTGAEAGIVTCGAAAGLTLAAAACLVRNDPELMNRLPDTTGLEKYEIIYPRTGPYDYDHPIRLSGAHIVAVDYDASDALDQIEASIRSSTAAIGYGWHHVQEKPPIQDLVKLAHSYRLPFIVDGAMSLPPVNNLRRFIELGVDVVTFSGGKHLQGPQASGILCGRTDLIRSAWLQMVDMDVRASTWSLRPWVEEGWIARPPRHGIGRSMKVGKEAIVGLMKALELYEKRDHQMEFCHGQQRADEIASGLRAINSLKMHRMTTGPTGQPYPTIQIDAEDAATLHSLLDYLRQLRPKIVLAEDEKLSTRAYIYCMCLREDHAEQIIVAFKQWSAQSRIAKQ